MLFDQCKSWLQARGMEAMDGPINFGNRDRWWGLLIEGYQHEPNYQCNYNFPYYKDLFEAYGFQAMRTNSIRVPSGRMVGTRSMTVNPKLL